MRTTSRLALLAVTSLAVMIASAAPLPETPPATAGGVKATSMAASVFAEVSPAVVVITTTLTGSERRNSHGSGFIVNERGWAVTNFHVVSSALFEPERYRLSHRRADGSLGDARVLAIDVINDLAIVEIASFGEGLAAGWKPVPIPGGERPPVLGESIFAIGNPLDLGVTVSQGTYSGTIAGTFDSRIHLTGALNPGMSGGPAVDEAGRLVGVNVARSLNGELVSFLVPAHLARQLIDAAGRHAGLDHATLRELISGQLRERQSEITQLAFDQPWQREQLGPYSVPIFLGDHSDCGASSNDSPHRPPAARVRSLSCWLKTSAMPQPNNRSATLSYTHTLIAPQTPDRLNAFQIAASADSHFSRHLRSRNTAMTRQTCEDRFTLAGTDESLPVRVLWCVQAYRDFEDVYDISFSVATQDRGDTVLVSQLSLEGFTFDNALRLTEQFLRHLDNGHAPADPS